MIPYLRPEYLCGIPEEEWDGCAPPSLVMTDIPNEVRQGQGGWDKSDFLFEIRGKSYLYDNVKASHPLDILYSRFSDFLFSRLHLKLLYFIFVVYN